MEATTKKTKNSNASTAQVNAADARIDALKEQYRSTPQELDFERIRIMKEVYDETVGYEQVIRTGS
jgi:hypothetical protein